MDQFFSYIHLGLEHILDVDGIDHILFVIVLAAIYTHKEWKQLLWLITAFTIGHSLTLALAALEIVHLNSYVIEALIPITILITAISNILIQYKERDGRGNRLTYFYAVFFGLIHGLGFSNYFKSLLGKDFGIIQQLLAFNIGLEVGQIIIISLFLIIGFIFLEICHFKRRVWIMSISSIVAVKALHLIYISLG